MSTAVEEPSRRRGANSMGSRRTVEGGRKQGAVPQGGEGCPARWLLDPWSHAQLTPPVAVPPRPAPRHRVPRPKHRRGLAPSPRNHLAAVVVILAGGAVPACNADPSELGLISFFNGKERIVFCLHDLFFPCSAIGSVVLDKPNPNTF
jgi:hypothetical protein